jgi:cytochrome P450
VLTREGTYFYFMDPYIEYKERREKTPVFWDELRRLWAVYPYRYCQQVLAHPGTLIPAVDDGDLRGRALAVKRRLVRISNGPAHDLAREMAIRVFRGRKPVNVGTMLGRLLPAPGQEATVEWVSVIGKVLPAMHILAGYGFAEADVAVILGQLPAVLKIMAPVSDARALEAAMDIVYPLVDRQVATCFPGLTEETQEYAVSNLIGLLIQSHDATKGLLSLALLHLLAREDVATIGSREMEFFLSFVTEVLRFDSPVHNTRRLLTTDLVFDGVTVPSGATLLVVVAAGNRDPSVFERAEEFDRNRANNLSMLTFGHGVHGCIAGMYCTLLAAETMHYLFHTYRKVAVVESSPEYEPLVNVRMVAAMHVRLG